MTNRDVIENKISAGQKYLAALKEYAGRSREEIENDATLRAALERYLYLAAQSAIDLAEAIISAKNFRKPVTMAESFSILAEEKVIPQELSRKLIKLVGFRNILAHEYTAINYDIVFDVLQNRLSDIVEFLEAIKQAIYR